MSDRMIDILKDINEGDAGYTTEYRRKTPSDKEKMYETIKHLSLDELSMLEKRIKQLKEVKEHRRDKGLL